MLLSAVLLGIILQLQTASGQFKVPKEPNVLTPPYFNIATGKKIESTATCGLTSSQIYCKLTGGPNEYRYQENLHQGHFCEMCDASEPTKSHPINYAIDGTEKWWQSPPLSEGTEYNKINITLNLGQVFHVAYVIIKFANSPRAGTWVLERSSDHGKTFHPWQYFANSDSDCHNLFGIDAHEVITSDDSVVCTADYSDVVPLERGEVIVSTINRRPGAKNFSHSPILQEWTRATNIRLRLLRTKTLLGHLMAVQRQDPTVTRRYYYSIKDISVGGRCVCNGHADTCIPDPYDKYKLKCQCRHNTCGHSCEYCCRDFVQKEWKPAVPESSNECEPCNCHGHGEYCVYDEQVAIRRLSLDMFGNYEGGGVCQNCTHDTAGINCEKCADGFYRPANVDPRDPNGCKPCDCDSAFTVGTCEPVTGRCYCQSKYAGDRCDSCAPGYHDFPECEECPCFFNATRNDVCEPQNDTCPCKYNFAGMYCNECAAGFYNFPECIPCTCNGDGAMNQYCDQRTGQCVCDQGFGGMYCDQCSSGYFNYPLCQPCSCQTAFTTAEVCDMNTGVCLCTDFVTGESCNQCIPEYYDFPQCKECECASIGSTTNRCHHESGKCECHENYQGTKCDECAPGFYNYPNCIPCSCNQQGSLRTTCDVTTGQCACYSFISGRQCNQCSPEYFNFPRCEDCKCDPRGINEFIPGVCLAFTVGQCDCRENVVGKYCDRCSPLHYDMSLGCIDCNCFLPGTLDGVAACESESGACWCKSYTSSKQCSQCEEGFYGLDEKNYFGCAGCQCDAGGSMSEDCDTVTGKCRCKRGVTGRQCNQLEAGFYIPSFLQYKYEAEFGRVSEEEILRFGFDPERFPGYSMKGYSEFSNVQDEVIIPINVESSGLYRILFYYIQYGEASTASVVVSPVTAVGSEQMFEAVFEVKMEPTLMTSDSVLVLTEGEWNVIIRGKPGLLIDYLIVLPSQYYEPVILQAKIHEPCKLGAKSMENECLMYTHPSLDHMPGSPLSDFASSERYASPSSSHPQMVLLDGHSLDKSRRNLSAKISPDETGKYVVVLEYASLSEEMQTVAATITDGRLDMDVNFNIYACEYAFLCRQVALTSLGDIAIFDITLPNIRVDMSVDAGEVVYVSNIYAIPHQKWTMEYVEPKRRCITKRETGFNDCIAWVYPTPAASRKFEVGRGGDTSGINPPTATASEIDVIYVTDNTTVQIEMNLEPGRYLFLLHYYNPQHLSFWPSVVISGGIIHEGVVNVTYCPSGDGCRGVVTANTGEVVLPITSSTQTMTITVPKGKSFWLDYVLAIPESSYRVEALDLMKFDHTRKFFEDCFVVAGKGLIELAENPSEFCRLAVFTLTTGFNDGALACNCSYDGTIGSSDITCEEYGGRCLCKPNVIGRSCDKCAIGHFGYPDCRPCDCNTTFCDEDTGDCICPPNTAMPECDHCVPFTHTFHALAGCVACDCNKEGVEDAADLGCSEENGQCRCRDNVEGRRCDRCMPGYFGFPECRPCVCDQRGRISEGCDPFSGQCLCKENVEGQQCDRCKSGSFYLDGSNPLGCTKCFCFGVSTDCSSTMYPATEITEMNGWRLLNIKTETPEVRVEDRSVTVDIIENGGAINPNRAELYWAAPNPYLYNQIGSYGGVLRYTVNSGEREAHNNSVDSGFSESEKPAPLIAASPNVILKGNGMVLATKYHQNTGVSLITLTESNFLHHTSAPVTREEMMMVLENLESLHVLASDDPEVKIVSISDVSLTTTNYDAQLGSGLTIRTVEECICPKGYTGYSCQICSRGHYREELGPYLGFCAECDCYGHCDQCDKSGNLIDKKDCLHNTAGDRCEQCKEGYIGVAKSRDPDACQICPCPYSTVTGNFAKSCEYDEDELVCHCENGYSGARCELCDVGYFGNPIVIGGKCQTCDCHGNLDVEQNMETCNTFTGECMDCKFNTAGKFCERCSDGYYGDAVHAHNCTECSCLACGTSKCDYKTGQCTCKPHVAGTNCDQCELGFFNLDSCNGCRDCACAIGAKDAICDTMTGQCVCSPNVVGLKCDKCAQGHWDYSSIGCKPCNCLNYGDCNPATGECYCPPGITGPHCDQCELKRHVIPPHGSQCEPCDRCTHELLNIIEPLTGDILMTSEELSKISVGVVAARRFEKLYSKTEETKNVVHDLQNHEDDINVDVKSLLKPNAELENDGFSGSGEFESSGEFGPIIFKESKPDSYTSAINTLNKVEALVSTMCNQTETLLEIFEKTFSRSLRQKAEIFSLSDEVRILESNSLEALEDMNSESSGEDEEYDKKMNQGEMLLERLRTRTLKPMRDMADPELTIASELFSKVNIMFTLPATDMGNQDGILIGNMEDKIGKMKVFRNILSNCIKTVNDISAMNDANSKDISKAKEVISRVSVTWEEIRQYFEDAQNYVDQVGRNRSEVIANDALIEALSELQLAHDNSVEKLDGKKELVNKTVEKSNMLDEDSKTLVRIYNETKTNPRNIRVIDASNRYRTIVNAMEEAKEAANAADLDSTEARDEVVEKNLDDVATNASKYSAALLTEATQLVMEGLNLLQDEINNAKKFSNNMTSFVNDLSERHDTLKQGVAALDTGDIDEPSQNAKSAAADAEEIADVVMDTARKLQDKIDQAPDPDIPLQSELKNIKKIFNSIPDKLKRADNKINNLREKLASVSKLSNDLALDEKMKKIRKLIELSRSRADTVRVAMKYEKKDGRDTPEYTQLRIPPYVSSFDDFIRIELYVNVSTSNNSLLYLGDVSSKNGDYISLATKEGRVVYNYKVGTGEGEVVSSIKIDDGKWHRITVQRIGNQGDLGVEYIATDVTGNAFGGSTKKVDDQQGTTDTDNIRAHMPFESTALVVGGNPIVSLPDKLHNRHMSGCIQNVKVNGEDIGLWNFVSYNGPQPAQTCRDTVPDAFSTSTYNRMWKFRGINSYVRINKQQLIQQKFIINSETRNFIIRFKFSTTQSNALLFFAGDSVDQFFAIELRNGKFVIACNFGWKEPKQGTAKMFPDANSHSQSLAVKAGVIITSRNKLVVLAINSRLILNLTFSDWTPKFDSDVWIGGIHRYNKIDELRPYVTKMDDNFRGCLGQLGLTYRSTFSIYDAYERMGVTRGCEGEMIINLKISGNDYITVASALPNVQEVAGLVTIRSDNPEGTILQAEETESVHHVTLFMRDGHVVFSDGTWEVTSEERYDDGQSHTIKFERFEDGGLFLNVDDDDLQTVEGEATEQPARRRKRRIQHQNKESAAKISLFAKSPVHIHVGGTDDLLNFDGCISNIRIEGDSRHPDLLTDGARCGYNGNIKCSGKPLFNKCTAESAQESAVTSVSLADPTVLAAKSASMEEGEISAHDFTMGRMTMKGGDSNGENNVVNENEGNKKKNGRRKRNRNKSGNRNQTILGIDAARPFDSGYDRNCHLPLEPETSGFFYPGDGYSRCSVSNFNSMNWRFSLRMRTGKKEGIIFFMCTTGCPEHIAVYLFKGKVTLSVKFGEFRKRIKSSRRFNDGYWHDITFQRKATNLQMIIDDTITNLEFLEISHTFSSYMLFYVGGLQAMEKRDAENFINPMHLSDFHGCIQDLVVNDQAIETSSQSHLHFKINLRPCFEGETEEGIFFPNTDPSDDGAYMMVYNIYNVGMNLEVTMEIRPRTQSGVMLAVGGYTGNFFQLLLVDGKVVATMRQGSDRLMSVYDPTDFGHTLCDGNWHKVNVTKAKNILILNVDGNQVQPIVRGNIDIRNCHTDGPLYIGGIPRDARVGRPLADRRQYTGCMRKIKVDYFNITTNIAIEVKSGVSKALCPLY